MSHPTDPQGVTRRTRLGVYGLAIQDDHILLARISERVPGGVGKWTLPGGGMDWGETAEQTLRREMWEETGLEPEVGRLIHVESFGFERPDIHWHAFRAVYGVGVRGQPRVTETDGTVDLAAWHHLDDLERIPLVRLVGQVLESL